MLTAFLDFICSRPFPSAVKGRARWVIALSAIFWAVLAYVLGLIFCADVSVQGENAAELLVATGLREGIPSAYPVLRGLTTLLLGASPSVQALNLLGAALMGLVLSMTWLLSFYWMRDAMADESIERHSVWISVVGSHVVCALLLFSLGGLYTLMVFTKDVWCFGLLLVCVALQNLYAEHRGNRWLMLLFATVFGMALVESPWVLLLSPLFLGRTLMVEWRLWDHSVRNLPMWFTGILLGLVLTLLYGVCRLDGSFIDALKQLHYELPRSHYYYIQAFFTNGMPWLLNLILGVGLPFLAWITARNLLNNDRRMILLFTGGLLTVATFALAFGVSISPIKLLMTIGVVPLATTWMFALAAGMLLMGWGVQLFARNPNLYEELDRQRIPMAVRALRVAAILLFPLSVFGGLGMIVVHGTRMQKVDFGLMDRFAMETVRLIAPGSGTPAEGHTYLLGQAWIDPHLELMARKANAPLVLLSVDRMADPQYVAQLETTLRTDPLLGENIDRKRLTNLLTIHGLRQFLIDFFAAHPNVNQLALTYNAPDIWRQVIAQDLQPMPFGTAYVGVPVGEVDPMPAYREWKGLTERWTPILKSHEDEWYDLNEHGLNNIRHHIGFMSNNVGVFLDDQSMYLRNRANTLTQELAAAKDWDAARIAEVTATRDRLWDTAVDYHRKAAECYLYAREIDKKNLSALLNLADICRSDDTLLPEKQEEIRRAMEEMVRAREKDGRRYSVPGVQSVYGTIRDEAMLVNFGPIWSMHSAPDTLLTGLFYAQSRLSPSDVRNATLHSAIALIREMQGETELAIQDYRLALQQSPRNVNALRALARIAIQEGRLEEAEKGLAEAERVFNENVAGLEETEHIRAMRAEFELDRSALAVARGDLPTAKKILEAYTADYPDSVMGWTMLGLLRIEEWATTGDEQSLRDASGYILQSIKRTVKKDSANLDGSDRYFQYIFEARLAQAEAEIYDRRAQDMTNIKSSKLREDAAQLAKDSWIKARNNYYQARAIRPNVKGILVLILDIDRRLADKNAAERDALTLLREDPRNPVANFIIGSQRLKDGDVNAAIIYFKNAIEGNDHPPADVVTNYADALSRTNQYELACSMGKLATELAPKSYITWSTYALTLARSKQVAEAKAALAQAHEAFAVANAARSTPIKPDPRQAFVNIWIAIAEQNRAEAEKLLADLRKALGSNLIPLDTVDIEDVSRAIQALPTTR